ncbi:uncharacterized protein LOC125674188 isoform X2 [Ostrea edulis]|uniref:uncharacterized protein LOC125674188 isoform X2 n=1 Tax=Ostrea edulis TaxID=37623 RepID=UPI0020948E1A|nr:uncharacterized protein LOC125674188 isoform X2 [Ostrea edulis]
MTSPRPVALQNSVGTDTYCCGSEFIRKDYGCCNGTIAFNRSVSDCVKYHVVPRGHDFCNGIQFDKRKQTCCGNSRLHNVPSGDWNFRCCGMALIDDRKQRCCSDNVQPKSGYCCGTGVYNRNNQICCRRNIISSNGTLGCCGGGSYDKRHQTCCHGKAIQKETEICCQGTVHNINNVEKPQCCGRSVYSRTSQLFCRNDVITDKTKTHHFNTCGKQPYDGEKDLCCNMQIHKGAKGSGRKCCGSGTKNYNPKTEECHLNDVKNKTDSHPDKKEPQTFGISTACSPEWTPSKMQKFIKDKKIYICRRNAYVMEVKSFELYNRTDTLQKGTLLNVAVKHKINNAKNGLEIDRTFTLDLPCSSAKLQKQNYEILLVTDMDVKPPKKLFYLGDSDIILPYKTKIGKIIKRKLNTCEKHIVRNIYAFIKQTLKSKKRLR